MLPDYTPNPDLIGIAGFECMLCALILETDISKFEPRQAQILLVGELASRWNQIYPSLLNTYEKLKKLGFTYINGEIFIILPEKEEKGV